MMALPLDFPPVRVADTYSANETAVAQTVTKQKITWDAGQVLTAANGRQLPLTDWGAFIFPSLLRHQVVYTILGPQAVVITNWTYQAAKKVDGTQLNLDVKTDMGQFDVEPGVYIATGQTQPHGLLQFCGTGAGKVGVWIDATSDAGMNATVTVTFNRNLPTASTAELISYQWVNGRWTLFNKTSVGAGLAIISYSGFVTSGYYAFAIGMLNPNLDNLIPTTYTLQIQCRCTSSWAHHYVNHALLNLQNIGRNRVLGTSFLLQNEASVMNKQGNVVAMQIPAGLDWYQAFAGSGLGFYSTLFDDDNSRTFLLETGIYGFKRPKGSQDFDWENEVDNLSVPNGTTATGGSVGFVSRAYFQLDCPCDFLALAASANTLGAGDCLLSTAAGLEYTTQNSWLEKSTPVISESAFKLGIATLREVDQFYENPIHIPSLMDAISSGMRTMAPIVGLFPGLGPALAGGLATGGSIVSQVRNAIYGNNDSEEQGGNQKIKQAQNAKKRQSELAQVVDNGRMGRAVRVKRRIR